MYRWRSMTPEERERVLAERRARNFPWHSPPHFDALNPITYLITAACFEHRPIIGTTFERLEQFERRLLEVCGGSSSEVYAWCILPNHYHVLLKNEDFGDLRKRIGLLHGSISREWNLEDAVPGRKVWHGFSDRRMRSRRHFWASMNYVHHNPVKHGCAKRWQDWEFSSAARYLERTGKQQAEFVWKEYPLLDYGAGWDDCLRS